MAIPLGSVLMLISSVMHMAGFETMHSSVINHQSGFDGSTSLKP